MDRGEKMSEINNEEQLRSSLKNIYRPFQISQALKERVWFSVSEALSNEAMMTPRHFLFREPAWVAMVAVIALALISFGMLFPPG